MTPAQLPLTLGDAVMATAEENTGAQLALGSCEFSKDWGERFVTLVTAAFCVWNVGLGFLAGMVGAYLNERGLLELQSPRGAQDHELPGRNTRKY